MKRTINPTGSAWGKGVGEADRRYEVNLLANDGSVGGSTALGAHILKLCIDDVTKLESSADGETQFLQESRGGLDADIVESISLDDVSTGATESVRLPLRSRVGENMEERRQWEWTSQLIPRLDPFRRKAGC